MGVSGHSLAAAIVLLSFCARLINLDVQGLWYDEAYTLLLTTTGPGEIARRAAIDTQQPLYFWLLWLWGTGPPVDFWPRCFSVLAGTVSVALVYAIARSLAGPRVALAGALFTAVAPFHVFYSQEVRMYALLGLLDLLAVWGFLQGWRGRRGGWALYAAGTVLALYTHALGALPSAALICWAMALAVRGSVPWKALVPPLLALCVAGLLYLPWSATLTQQAGRVFASFWAAPPGLLSPLASLYLFVFGPFAGQPLFAVALASVLLSLALLTARTVWAERRRRAAGMAARVHGSPFQPEEPRSPSPTGPSVGAGPRAGAPPSTAIAAGGSQPSGAAKRRKQVVDQVVARLRPIPDGGPGCPESRNPARSLGLLWAWAAVPLLLLLALSLVRSVYLERVVIGAAFPVYILLGWGLVRRGTAPFAALSLACALWGLRNWYVDPAFGKPPQEAAVTTVVANWRAGEPVLHTSDGSYLPFAVYAPALPHRLLAGDPEVAAGTPRARSTVEALSITPVSLAEAIGGADRFHLVVTLDHSIEFQRALTAGIKASHTLVEEKDVGGISVGLYAARAYH